MLTSEEIRTVTFEKSMRGYRPEDVDAFLEQVAAGVDQLSSEKEDLEKKLYILAQKVEEYRDQENTLKSALINAQRLGENVIHEAKAKADSLMREATSRAQRILDAAEEREREKKDNLRNMEAAIVSFKGAVLELYQQHIESLSKIDRHIDHAHKEVFGEAYAPEGQQAQETPAAQDEVSQDTDEEITAELVEASVDDAIGSIVDSYEDAVLNKDAD